MEDGSKGILIRERRVFPSTHTRARAHIRIILLADRYHVSYAFCHGEIHSTIFHLSPAGSRKELMRDSAGDGTSRVGGNKKRRHVARWILAGKGMMESGGKSSRKCKRGETKIFSVFKKQKSEVMNVIGLERGWGGLRRGWSLEGKKGRKSDVERKISLLPKKRKQG